MRESCEQRKENGREEGKKRVQLSPCFQRFFRAGEKARAVSAVSLGNRGATRPSGFPEGVACSMVSSVWRACATGSSSLSILPVARQTIKRKSDGGKEKEKKNEGKKEIAGRRKKKKKSLPIGLLLLFSPLVRFIPAGVRDMYILGVTRPSTRDPIINRRLIGRFGIRDPRGSTMQRQALSW